VSDGWMDALGLFQGIIGIIVGDGAEESVSIF